MKKVSTVAVKATKNFSQLKLTIGLDLGDRSSWYCLLDEVGDVVQEERLRISLSSEQTSGRRALVLNRPR